MHNTPNSNPTAQSPANKSGPRTVMVGKPGHQIRIPEHLANDPSWHPYEAPKTLKVLLFGGIALAALVALAAIAGVIYLAFANLSSVLLPLIALTAFIVGVIYAVRQWGRFIDRRHAAQEASRAENETTTV